MPTLGDMMGRPQPIGAVPMRGEAGFRPLMMGNPSAAQPGYISRYEYRHQQNDPFAGKGNPMSDGGMAQPMIPQGGMGLGPAAMGKNPGYINDSGMGPTLGSMLGGFVGPNRQQMAQPFMQRGSSYSFY